ncbi:MAG: Unknown protein [uncultured Aureispira sp.]|uniref:Uncharacterized protein n=1 Tax=uncultured Aureispira sp. TaxID=1331704 RepID=A0A6S6U4G4_9BACT|nr:MAG: Unknown protein [uncultured Aureispira sp.]
MKTYWKTLGEKKGMEYYVEIKKEEKQILFWETSGHWKSERGTSASFKQFLKGECDGWILKDHGRTVLSEIQQVVQDLESKI